MSNHMKRLTIPKSWKIPKKQSVWAVKPSPGKHPISHAMPLGMVVRDLLGYADKVYLVARGLKGSDSLLKRLQDSEVEVLEGTWVKEIHGENAVTEIELENGETVKVDGIFIELGSKGALELATQIGVQLDMEHFKYIDVNRKQETNIPGVYAAGDIVGPPYQMAKAVGEGCVAGMEAATYARKQKRAQ